MKVKLKSDTHNQHCMKQILLNIKSYAKTRQAEQFQRQNLGMSECRHVLVKVISFPYL